MQPFVMYHPEYAPNGRDFDIDESSDPPMDELARQGWVDASEKFGNNMWGEESEKHVKEAEQRFRDGKVAAVDLPMSQDEIIDGERQAREVAEKQRDDALRQLEDLKTRQARREEEFQDQLADVIRRQDVAPDTDGSVQVPGDKPEGGEGAEAKGDGDPPGDDGGTETVSEDEKIKRVMRTLDPKNPDEFTNTGKPEVKVIETLAGVNISAARRDKLWAEVQAEADGPDL